jgi:FMN phosphatase YigB (HAD superfamily)
MRPRIRLVVTDLDNTLYDWVTFFATAFTAMVDVAVRVLEIDREKLLDELRTVHRRYHNSEQPFALLETDSARERFPTTEDRVRALNEAFYAFNSVRKRSLHAYPTVIETLSALKSQGVRVAGHTEATVPNAQFRLGTLEIAPFIERLYALEHVGEPHPAPERSVTMSASLILASSTRYRRTWVCRFRRRCTWVTASCATLGWRSSRALGPHGRSTARCSTGRTGKRSSA